MDGLLLALFLAASLSIAVSAAPSPGAVQSGPAAGRDTVVIGIAFEPDILHPLFFGTLSAGDILQTLFTRDVQLDDRWRAFPQGVESLPSIRDGTWRVDGERMTLTWKIKPRRWHDGRPVTCADYVFTHKVARDERVPVDQLVRLFAPQAAGVTCPRGAGGREVVVTWAVRDAAAPFFVLPFGRFVIPRHVLEPAYRANPARLGLAPFGFEPGATIGDGPYRLVEWRKGASITVEAVPAHPVFGTPRVKRIIWRVISNPADRAAAIRAGDVDVTTVSLEDAVSLERQAGGGIRVQYAPSGFLEQITFNLDNPFLQDLPVRRAIAYGINRSQIVHQLFAGRQPAAHSFYPPQHIGSTEAVTRYPYSPARARALLKDMGFVEGPDGILRDASGARLSLELTTTHGGRDAQVRLIQEHLRQVGIEITVVTFPPRVLFSEILPRRRFKALAVYAGAVGPFATCDGVFTSWSVPTEANRWTGYNYSGYRDRGMDEACTASGELDTERRIAALRRSASIFSHDLPALPLYWRMTAAASKGGLQNVSLGFPLYGQFWNIPTWFWTP